MHNSFSLTTENIDMQVNGSEPMSWQKPRILLISRQIGKHHQWIDDLRAGEYQMEVEPHYQTVRDGEETGRSDYSAVVLDVIEDHQTNGRGYDVRQIKQDNQDTPLILLLGEKTSPTFFEQVDIYGYLYKPVDYQQANLMLQRATEHYNLKRTLTQKQKRHRRMQRQNRHFRTLRKLAHQMNSIFKLEDLLGAMLQEGLQAIKTQSGSIMLFNPSSNILEMKVRLVGDQFVSEQVYFELEMGEGIAGYVAETGQIYNCVDAATDPRCKMIPNAFNEGSILSVPIISHGRVLGVINAVHPEPYFFQAGEINFLALLAGQVALAIETQLLRDMTNVPFTTLDINRVLTEVIKSACLLTGTQSGAIIWADELGHPIGAIRFPGGDFLPRTEGLAYQVITSGKLLIVDDAQHNDQVKDSSKASGIQTMCGLPIKVQARHESKSDCCIGALFVNSIYNRAFSTHDFRLLNGLANKAALVIENARLYQSFMRERERMFSLFEASDSIISLGEPEQILQQTVDQAGAWSQASGVTLMLVNTYGQATHLATTGLDTELNIEADQFIRTQGLSIQIINNGRPDYIEGSRHDQHRLNPKAKLRGIKAALGIPFKIRDKTVGVMWIHYQTPRLFSMEEIVSIQLYLNHAAITYDNARRIRELEHMQQAVKALSSVAQLADMLKQIVDSACLVLQATSAAIQLYDPDRKEFLLDNSVTAGVPFDLWRTFQKKAPKPGHTAYTIMEQGWIGVNDIQDAKSNQFIGQTTRNLLKKIMAKSFQGVALKIGDEKLGVLYVNYDQPRHFAERERKTAQTFAHHAALALKKVRLLDQVNTVRNVAYIVARKTMLEDLDGTLNALVQGVQDILGCDAISLYVYNPEQKRLTDEPKMRGVYYPERAASFSKIPQNSIVFKMLQQEQPYIVEDITTHHLFKKRRFVIDEQIKSCVAIPLRAQNETVGVLFINYRQHHHFSPDELKDIELFALQAAVAIRNVQLYTRIEKRVGTRQTLLEASQAVTNNLNLDETLFAIAEQASKLTGAARSSHLARVDDNKLSFVAAYPRDQLPQLTIDIGRIDFAGMQPIGITGTAVKARQSILVGNVIKHPNYIIYDTETRSELAVPIMIGNEIIGAINVEHHQYDAFDTDDQTALESLAAQAAIAIQNARLYAEKKRQVHQMSIIAEISRLINMSLDLDKILNDILSAVKSLIAYSAAKICLWHPDQAVMHVYSQIGDFGSISQDGEVYYQEDAFTSWILHHYQPLLIQDLLTQTSIQFQPDDAATLPRSFVGVPLYSDNELLGTLELLGEHPNAFSPNDMNLLKIIGQQAMIAIKNARLFASERENVRHLRRIHHIASLTNITLDSSEIFRRVLSELLDIFDLDQGRVTLFDHQDQFGYGLIEYPEIGSTRKTNVAIPLTNNLIFEHLFTHKIPLARNTVSDDLKEALSIAPHVQSVLIVPITTKNEVMGAFWLEAKYTKRNFTQQEIHLAQIMVAQVSTAIENAQLYDKLQYRVRFLETLSETGHILTKSLDLNEIFEKIVEQAWKLTAHHGTKISFACVALVKAGRTELITAYPPEKFTPAIDVYQPLADNAPDDQPVGVMGRIARTGVAEIIPNVLLDKDYVACHPSTRSELAVPIMFKDEVFGVINVEHPRFNAFDMEDLSALTALAAQASIAIDNAQLFEKVERHADLLDATAQVARKATSFLDEKRLMDESVDLIVNSFDFLYHAGVFLLDKNKEWAILQAASSDGGKQMLKNKHQLRVGKGIVGYVTKYGQSRLTPDVSLDPHHYVNPHLPRTKAEMAFPLKTREEVFGALDVQSMDVVDLSDEDIAVLQIMADQLANAIHNAQLYQEVVERLNEANILKTAAFSLAGKIEHQQILNVVMIEAMNISDTQEGGILFWDAQTEQFVETLRIEQGGNLYAYESSVRSNGWTRKIVDEQQTLVVSDMTHEANANPQYLAKGYRAAIGVPLSVQDQVIGVLHVRSKSVRYFEDRQVELLESLADHAAVAIARSRQYEELRQTKGMVGARTALAWMGMANNTWRHTIEKHAVTIRDQLQLFTEDLQDISLPQAMAPKLNKRLEMIERLAKKIMEKPLTPPLSAEESLDIVVVNEFVQERAKQLWENTPYNDTTLKFECHLATETAVKVSPEWLRRAFDILVDNAVNAISQCNVRVIKIGTRRRLEYAQIFVADTGPGLPKEIEEKIGLDFIEKAEDARGLGMGLLMAQTIVQTYGGDIKVEKSGADGTTMVITLPLDQDGSVE